LSTHPPTRLRAVRIRRKSQQKNNTNLNPSRANFRIENQKRKRKPGARWESQKYVRVLFLLTILGKPVPASPPDTSPLNSSMVILAGQNVEKFNKNDKYRIFLIFLDFIFIDLLEWMVSKCQESAKKEQFRSWPYRKHTISKQLGVIIFERRGSIPTAILHRKRYVWVTLLNFYFLPTAPNSALLAITPSPSPGLTQRGTLRRSEGLLVTYW